MKPYSLMSEAEVQEAVAKYLLEEYPDVLFHSDFGSGAKLTPGQAKRQKRQNGGRRAWPDMFIAKQRTLPAMFCKGGAPFPIPKISPEYAKEECDGLQTYAGLFLELKKPGTKLIRQKDVHKILIGETKLRKKGDWWDLHIEEQANMLEELRKRGYCAEFAVGFEEARKIIDEYLGGKK